MSSNHRLVHLDMARGVAALAVCAEHLRNFQFVGYPQVAAIAKPFDKFFYFLTGLGHQSVMIFFVLSGYFVGGSVLRDWTGNKWSWTKFAGRRLIRLYMVLIPALVLTLLLDSLGRGLAGAHGYDGTLLSFYHSGPLTDAPAQDGVAVFAGNALFLQTILCPVYGSNGPLWSLAYEFWYYLMFPLAMSIFYRGQSWLYRSLCALLLAGCLTFLPSLVLEGGLVWLMGCAIYWGSNHVATNECLARKRIFIPAGLVLATALVLSRVEPFSGCDYLIGIGFALMLPYLTKINQASQTYSLVAIGLSDISYTLYLAHFPVLAFFFFSFRPGMQMNPSLTAYGEFVFFLAVILAYAAFLWWLFERRTDTVRKALERKLVRA